MKLEEGRGYTRRANWKSGSGLDSESCSCSAEVLAMWMGLLALWVLLHNCASPIRVLIYLTEYDFSCSKSPL